MDVLLQFLCRVEEYLVDVVLELAVGVGEEVLDDLRSRGRVFRSW